MIKTAIIDDEQHGIKTLKHYLVQTGLVEIVFTAEAGAEALPLLQNNKIDVLFLDIEMPGLNGFDMLNQLKEIDFKVVFVTAYNQYAIKAIKMNALDYLLKPIDPEDLVQAVDRLRIKVTQSKMLDEKIKVLLSNINPANKIKRYGLLQPEMII